MTIPKLIEAIAAACGIHPSTLVRYFAELRAAQLIRVSGRGGGRAAVDLNHWEGATVIAALCALGPSGVVDAVATFKTLRLVGLDERAANGGMIVPNEGITINPTTGDFFVAEWHGPLLSDLANWIVRFAYAIRRFPDRKPAELYWLSDWELVACLDSSTATISFTESVGRKIVLEYSDPQSELLEPTHPRRRRGIRRMTIVDAAALEIFALVFLDFVKAEAKTAVSHASQAASAPNAGSKQSKPELAK
jgi:hypothetical protein